MRVSYDTTTSWPTAELATLMAARILRPGMRVLELGAGAGTETLFLARRGLSVVAVESDREQLETLRERLGKLPRSARDRVEVVARDVLRHRCAPASFDAVVERLLLNNMYEEARHQRAVIDLAARALPEGAPLVLRTHVEGYDLRACGKRVRRSGSSIRKSAWQRLDAFFDCGPEITFASPVDAFSDEEAGKIVAAVPVGIVVAFRTSSPSP